MSVVTKLPWLRAMVKEALPEGAVSSVARINNRRGAHILLMTLSVMQEFRILSLNVWGLPEPLSKQKAVRMRAIAERLSESDYDIIALQELWVSSVDYENLKRALADRFPYSKFFFGGAFGMGLAIFSRYQIVSTDSISYSYNGTPLEVWKGDWIVGKGAGCATIDIPGLEGGLDVWVTHTIAAGGDVGPEWQRGPRITQLYELSKWTRRSAKQGRHVIALGDFNCIPVSVSANILREIGGLTDAFAETHPSLPPRAVALAGDAPPDPQQCLDELGVTADSPLNTWTAGKSPDSVAQKGAGKRLDYIYYTGPSISQELYDRSRTTGKLKAKECKVTFTERLPVQGFSYSDHFGVEATFSIVPEAAPITHPSPSQGIETLDASIDALSIGKFLAQKRQRQQLTGFVIGLILAVGLIIGSAFQPVQGVSAVFTFLGVAVGWAATTLLYSGLIWGEWEKRILRTMMESMALEVERIRFPARTARTNSTPTAAALI